MNRRDFLKTIGVIGACGMVGKPEAGENFSGHLNRFGMLTDISSCIGCRRCEEACSKANNLPQLLPLDDKTVLNRKRSPDAKAYTVVNRYIIEGKEVFRKVQCFHCEEPACASACLVGALKKSKEGPVTYNPNLCIGCRYCMVACPFYIPAYEYSNLLAPRVMKCQMCYDRIKEGKTPACCEACPMEAITFGKRSDLLKFAQERIVQRPDKYVNHIYGEREVGGTSWLYISPVPFEKLDFPIDVGTKPYPEYTKGFLSWVPVVLVLWPGILTGLYAITRGESQETGVKK